MLSNQDIVLEWNDPESDESMEIERQGTVFMNTTKDVTPSWLDNDLTDMFAKPANTLEQLFQPPPQDQKEQIPPEKLFGGQYDTFTKKRLSEIVAKIPQSSNPNVFSWKTASSGSKEGQPSLRLPETYPNDIDFLEELDHDSNSLEQQIEAKIEEIESFNHGVFSPSRPMSVPGVQVEFSKLSTQKAPSKSGQSDPLACSGAILESRTLESDFKRKDSPVESQQKQLGESLPSTSFSVTETPQKRPSPQKVIQVRTPTSARKATYSCDFSHQQLTSLNECFDEKSIITRLKLYYQLTRNHNHLTSLNQVPKTVQNLFVSCNKLSNLTNFSHLRDLVVLYFSHNQLTDLSSLSALLNLRELNASDNAIGDITPILRHQSLQNLDLRNNALTKLDFRFSNLYFCLIRPRLQYLLLSGNQITTIKHLYHLKNLQELFLDENQLLSFSVLKPLKQLHILNLNDNQIQILDVRNVPELKSLFVDRNNVVEFVGLQELRNIKVLSIESQIDGEIILGGPAQGSLLDLRLGGNIPKVDPSWCHSLDSLDLSGCALDHVPRLLQYATQLTFLSLERNDISDISMLTLNRKLKLLQLAQNRLSDVVHITNVVSKLPQLSILDIRDNLFVPPKATEAQAQVSNIILRTYLILSGKNLRILNQEPITNTERRHAGKKMETLKKLAVQPIRTKPHRPNGQVVYVQDWKSEEETSEWKPKLYPLDDVTVGDEIILEVVE